MRKINGHRILASVPLPTDNGKAPHTPREPKYPFHLMEVGESVYIKSSTPYPGDRHRLVSATHYARKRQKDGRRFTMRQHKDGYRVWRIE